MAHFSPLVRQQALCFSLVWLAYASTYLLRKPLGVVKADLGHHLGVGKALLGWCDTALVLPYAAVQILWPSLADTHGPRRVLSLCLAMAALATLATYRAESLATFCLGLALTGGLLAPAWPACTKLLGLWFQGSRLNTMFGLLSTAVHLGSLAGTALAAALLDYSGWRSVGLPPAIVALATAALLAAALATPQERDFIVSENTSPSKDALPSQSSVRELACLPSVPSLAAAMFCLKFVRYCLYMWLPLYLLEELHYTKLQAGVFSTVFDLGGILGSALLGIYLDRSGTAPLLGVTRVMAAGCLAMAAFLLTAHWGMAANMCCLLVVGAANCGADSILPSVTMEVGEREAGGRGAAVTSLVNGVGYLGALVEGPLVGALHGLVGWGGVLPLLVIVSGMGLLATHRAGAREEGEVLPT